MIGELPRAIVDLVEQAGALLDIALRALYAAGASGGMDAGPLAAGGAAAAAAAASGAAGADRDARRARESWTRFPRYRTTAGEPYIPGTSPIPADRVVIRTDTGGRCTVRDSGSIVHPLPQVRPSVRGDSDALAARG